MSLIEPEQPQKECLPHSRCGVVAIRLAIYSMTVFYALSCMHVYQVVVYPEIYKNPDIWYQEKPLEFIIATSGLWVCLLAALAAFIFGIVGVHQPRTRKVFSLLGILLSLYPFILVPVFATIIRTLGGGCC